MSQQSTGAGLLSQTHCTFDPDVRRRGQIEITLGPAPLDGNTALEGAQWIAVRIFAAGPEQEGAERRAEESLRRLMALSSSVPGTIAAPLPTAAAGSQYPQRSPVQAGVSPPPAVAAPAGGTGEAQGIFQVVYDHAKTHGAHPDFGSKKPGGIEKANNHIRSIYGWDKQIDAPTLDQVRRWLASAGL